MSGAFPPPRPARPAPPKPDIPTPPAPVQRDYKPGPQAQHTLHPHHHGDKPD